MPTDKWPVLREPAFICGRNMSGHYHHHCAPRLEAIATALHKSRSCASVRASVADMSVSLQTWRSHECHGCPRGRLHIKSGGVKSLESHHTARALATGTCQVAHWIFQWTLVIVIGQLINHVNQMNTLLKLYKTDGAIYWVQIKYWCCRLDLYVGLSNPNANSNTNHNHKL